MNPQQKTYFLPKEEVKRSWWLVDAKDKVLGRLASKISFILMGKHKSEYTNGIDCGDFVVVINSKKIKLTGKKLQQKYHYRASGYMGGLKQIRYDELLEKNPDYIIYLAVKGMLPKNRLRKKRLKRLKIYPQDVHSHQAQNPQPLLI